MTRPYKLLLLFGVIFTLLVGLGHSISQSTLGNVNVSGNLTGDNYAVFTKNVTASYFIGEIASEGDLNVNSSDYWDSLGVPSDLNNLVCIAGENITSGTIDFARLPTLTNTHTHDTANLTNIAGLNSAITLAGENITSGTIGFARLPSLTNTHTHDTGNLTNIAGLNSAITIAGENITSGTIDFARLPSLTNALTLDAANITNEIWVNSAGDTMSGLLNMTWNNITDVLHLWVANIHGASPITFWNDINATANITAESYLNSSGSLEWITPANILDVDDEDIETDLNTYVDIGGDTMTGDLGMGGMQVTNVANITFAGNITTNYIDDNSSCVVIHGPTAILTIC